MPNAPSMLTALVVDPSTGNRALKLMPMQVWDNDAQQFVAVYGSGGMLNVMFGLPDPERAPPTRRSYLGAFTAVAIVIAMAALR